MAQASFWNSPNMEPKRQYRWKLSLANSDLQSWMVKSVDKPTMTVGKAEHKYFGHTYKYPGTVTWNDINISIVDPVNPDAVKALATIIQTSGYNIPKSDSVGLGGLSSISKGGAHGALGEVHIRQYDAGDASGVSRVIEHWTLNNAFVISADFGGNLTYGSEELIELKITLAYDWATLTPATGNEIWK